VTRTNAPASYNGSTEWAYPADLVSPAGVMAGG
jgi:hypothetical protein